MAKARRSPAIHRSPWFVVFVLIVATFGVVQLVRAASGGVSGSPGTRVDTTQATDYVETTSPSYSTMPGMVVPFTTSNNAPAAATISVSSPTEQFGGCGHFMRLIVDGVATNEVPVLLSDRDTRSFTFISQDLSPGSHQAKIEWRIQMPYFAATGCAQTRSLVVMHH